MKQRKIATVDFETDAIERRPEFPPDPVGVAIKEGRTAKYLAWGHPTENNCTKAQAVRELRRIFNEYCVVFHNSAFDIEVALVRLGLKMPKEYHDTLFLAYLDDPRAPTLSLKPLSEKLLDMPSDEQDKLKEWILANVKQATQKDWGAYISLAPGKLVGLYAKGDVIRTEKLFHYFYARVKEADMLTAYEREIRLMPVVMRMEQGGIRCATKRLSKDLAAWHKARAALAQKIRKRLGITKRNEFDMFGEEGFNLGSNTQLADAMEHAGIVSRWEKTAKGNRSTSKDNLVKVCEDGTLLKLLAMHSTLGTYIGTFGEPWLRSAQANEDFIYPSFNQVRSTDEHGHRSARSGGTRTGRFSSSHPNFQNVPADVEESKDRENLIALAKFLKPFMKGTFLGLRDYLIPDSPDKVFIGRDYAQQEIRILAHYEDGVLLEEYLSNPKLDVHELVKQLIKQRLGVDYPRKHIKETGFGIIYGMGLAALAERLGISEEEARKLRSAYFAVLPGVKTLGADLKKLGRRNEALRTWGGRVYYCEEPAIIKGRMRTFEYKLLNLLIQGSAADCTKVAMLNVADAWRSEPEKRIVLQVHDELLACVPKFGSKESMREMREAMEDVKFDLPMLTDGKMSAQSWGRMKSWEG